jgi:DNA end-binding protein Ku
MRSIWKGAISFGLINIPVKLYSAVTESSLDLDMLDKKDHSNIKFKRVNASTGKEVSYENIVRGYMYHDDYVILDDEDFKYADAKKTNTIEIIQFVNEKEIDPIYYEQPFYLEPEKSGVKAYALLREALHAAGKVGLGTFVLRKKETLAVLKPYQEVIVLNRIRFEEEIRDFKDLNLPEVKKSSGEEQKMAIKLVDQLTKKFNIAKYKDTYTEKLLKVISQKAKGIKPSKPKLKVVHTQSDDLVEMLKASLEKKKKAS